MKKTLMVAMMLGTVVLSAPNKKFTGGTDVFAYEAGSGTSGGQKADLVFISGFENGVSLDPPRKAKGGWEQFIAGSDEGYDWGTDLPGRGSPKNRFTYLVAAPRDAAALAGYVTTRIETVTGHDGNATRALYMEITKEDPRTPPGTRDQFGIYPPRGMDEAYASMWVKLQPNLDRYRMLMEWKETAAKGERADFRWNINIRKNVDGGLAWGTLAQFGDLRNSPDAWQCISRDVPVPLGRWFFLEVYWKLDRTNGRVWAAVDGKTIADYRGRTQKDSGLYVWWPLKVYAGTALKSYPYALYQWVDDVKFYNRIPPDASAPRNGTFTCETF
ncbi:MAG: hypothetical protein HZA28_06510 [Candidatus Omnitrophica bacterium]|nr:hypothetical protein [Candidatus Omnitrophota bacterium]